ncbi:MAG: hypothetical protein JWL77_5596 [Chthonomonadaceae bacterium]|nr:hypothetical protein [Chthonomonadaceae bacterium]
MTRKIQQHGWVRPGLVLALLGAFLAAFFLLRSQPAGAVREAAREVFITPPLGIAAGQGAEIAFFLPGGTGGGPNDQIPVQLRLLDAETGQVLAQQEVAAGGIPGGGCLEFFPTNAQGAEHLQVVGVLIGLLRPGTPLPVASLQIFDTQTQRTTAALPAVQLTRAREN